jgi:hypothetical protein
MNLGAAITRPEDHDKRAWVLLSSNRKMSIYDKRTHSNYYYCFIGDMHYEIFKYFLFGESGMVNKTRVMDIFDELDYIKSFNAE